ncbi:MAG: site-specific integrase [Clostridiales bacterium]|nr:site-specific integrase [Clostridiales bacterium]
MNKSKPTDFARLLAKYLFEYLPEQKGLSEHTIKSYGDAMSLLLEFCETELHLKREKLEIKNITCELVEQFYLWLEQTKGNSVSTRNQRRIAINTFLKYLQYQNPGYVLLSQQIRSIPHKTDKRQTVRHLSVSAVEEILKKPDLKLRSGRRDFALLSLMYETAARVSEIADLCIGGIRFEKNGATVHLLGKGRKTREVPIIATVTDFLQNYLAEEAQRRHCQKTSPLFCNRNNDRLTRAGITYVLGKYADDARLTAPELIPEQVYPHILRHSRAMHWLEAGFDLQYIKDMLGHSDLSTTEIYARLNVEMKRKLLEQAHPVSEQAPAYPSWSDDKNLMNWLHSFQV